ncbi:MAG: helix-turn-helix transcriptional regulator [Alphaproteobacteria bacterium]|nr:helix-turn-helix transcriptional regulator [Alphaproteobacteria bacterium]
MTKKPPYRRTFIADWRSYRNLTQDDLAERVDTTQATISRLETGHHPYSQKMLEDIAKVLECKPEDLLMRRPTDGDPIHVIWENIPIEDRAQATQILETFAKRQH